LATNQGFDSAPEATGALAALRGLRCVLFDLDGVVYRGAAPLAGAAEIFRSLAARGIPYCIITNNATKTAHQYVDKLAAMGISVPESAIMTSGIATARYLAAREPNGAPVYVIGEVGLVEPLTDAGFWLDDRSPRYVCVGLDTHLTYDKLKVAALAIRAGATFIASNPDTTLPTEEGLVPGNGAILAALETATDVAPTVIGKPSAEIIDLTISMLGADKATTAIIGDRLDTDVLAGNRAGIGTVLILTGVHQIADLPNFEGKPDCIVSDLVEFRRLLDGVGVGGREGGRAIEGG
jgi:4-nitrophenyl phosphatase